MEGRKMKFVSFNEIIDCNEFLKQMGLNFKIHLRDACGRQSCWIEVLESNSIEGRYDVLYEALEEFFGKLGMKLEYSDDKINFWIG